MSSLPLFLPWRQTVRRFTRERGFVATVLLTLGLCLGANIAIFAVIDAVLLRALPYPEGERLVSVFNTYPGAGVERAGASLPNYYDRREAIEAFDAVAILQGGSAIVGEAGAPRRVSRGRVAPELFATLGVPVKGRTFTAEELDYARSGVAIITHGFWQSEFHGDPDVLGRTFVADGYDVEVIGLLPKGFRLPDSDARFFVPAASNEEDRGLDRRHSNNFQMIARLAPGATVAAAQAEIDAFNRRQVAEDPFQSLLENAGYATRVRPLRTDLVAEFRTTLLLLQGGVLALLLIGGVNLVNLLLIRASGRAKELAVRQALGAGRGRIASEILHETLLLGLLGGLLGCGLGAGGIRLLATLGADQLPLGATIGFDGRVALVAVLGSVAVGALLALPVIWFSLHRDLGHALNAESRGGTASRASQRLRHGFIVAQVGLAFVLLLGAGLLGTSLRRALQQPPGFAPAQLLTADLSLPYRGYPEATDRLAFLERLLAALAVLPGAEAVGANTCLPFSDNTNNNAIAIEGHTPGEGESIRAHYTSGVLGDYFRAMEIPLLEGRFLEAADNHREERVCVVDAVFARRYWGGESPLGRRLTNGPAFDEAEAHRIVGVVGAVKQVDLAEPFEQGAVYFPYRHYASLSTALTVRAPLPPAVMGQAMRNTVLELDEGLPLDNLRTMQSRIDERLLGRRSPAILAGIFAAVALLLAALGTYGVLAYAVNQRRREIGVRMALGALPGQVRGLFLGLGGRFLLLGTLFGVLGGWLLERGMRSVLYAVERLPWALVGLVAFVLFAVVLCASLIPSHRAARLSPLEALRD
jgi:predicted permease